MLPSDSANTTPRRVLSTHREREIKANLGQALEIIFEKMAEICQNPALPDDLFVDIARLPQQILLMATYRMSTIQEGQTEESKERTETGVVRCISNFDEALSNITLKTGNLSGEGQAVFRELSSCLTTLTEMKEAICERSDFSAFQPTPPTR